MAPKANPLSFLSILFLFPLFSCGESKEQGYDGRTFDISAKGDKSLLLKTSMNGSFYDLTIEGEGEAKDYASKNAVPWNPIAKRVGKVEIKEGITNIGDYYFFAINLDQIFLPSTVVTVAEHSFKADTKVFSFGPEFENAPENVYFYKENKPAGKGNYFYMDGDTPHIYPYSTPRFLFIGNSFTFRQGSEEDPAVPRYFKAIAKNLGQESEIDFVVRSSYTLTRYANATDELGKVVDQKLKNNKYDYVVLQEQSTTPINSFNNYRNAVISLKTKITQTQGKDCAVVLYETWGSPTGIQGTSYATVGAMEQALRTATESVAKEAGCRVHYIGKAFTYAYETEKLPIYDTDGRHQSNVGAYLSAACHVRSFFSYNVSKCTDYCSLDAKQCQAMLKVADKII